MSRRLILSLTLLVVILVAVIPVTAQDDGTAVRNVTDDEVNAIAKQLFCPVCENIPLDTCGTQACYDWREEIRMQLESGMTEEQVIDDFVFRFGDRVVGTPKSTAPRLLSLVTPFIVIAVGLYFGWQFYANNRRKHVEDVIDDTTESKSTYHDLLEKDVAG